MGYKQSYTETVSKTVEISYDPSKKGGSKSVLVTIPVQINIELDTDQFESSVRICERNVDLLTAAVVATEVAEVESRERNSIKVADSIINGFFRYIRSEISQQVTELSQKAESQLMLLRELMKTALSKKGQMEQDFLRISGRYRKIFEDLDRELSNRIFAIDKPAFEFKMESDNHIVRTLNNDLISTISVFGAENSNLIASLSTSVTKKRTLDTIDKAKLFLMHQKRFALSIQDSMLNEYIEGTLYSPVCYVESSNIRRQTDKNLYISSFLEGLEEKLPGDELFQRLSSDDYNWEKMSKEEENYLRLYFDSELDKKYYSNYEHSVRVRETIRKMADLSSINVIQL
ncbi:MAG: hypothetical protein A2X18_01650 [Bacteroidetes bacterium GWF2_40_14]|nr:MAG: hypothetical protein A2X18_01650 [Bacteroidetes bacterium GWF2_40_14]